MRRKKSKHHEPALLPDYQGENCQKLIHQMQHAEQALIDLMLYLDTHPYDFPARGQYTLWSQHYMMLKHRYQQCCGPLEWYGPDWWKRAAGSVYDPLDDCFHPDPIHVMDES
jgi:hypothetical protein